MIGAIEGLKVLEIGQWIAAPYCAAILADLGADVVKLERPGRGDDQRHSPPFARGQSALFSQVNRNKRSVSIDLASPDGAEACRKLAANADVVIDNYRLGALQRLGLTYDSVSHANPKLIWCAITGFGGSGSLKERAGMDMIAQAASGLADLNTDDTGQPRRLPMAVADISTGLYAAIGILAALAARQKTGRGQLIDVSLLESTLSLMPIETSICLLTGRNPNKYRERGFGNASPYQIFQTADGWLALAAASQPLWEDLCQVLEASALRDDPRFATSADRIGNAAALEQALGGIFQRRPTDEWLKVLDAARIPAGPVMTTQGILSHAHIRDRGLLASTTASPSGLETVVSTPIRLSDTPVEVRRGSPNLGEHTVEVLAAARNNSWPALAVY